MSFNHITKAKCTACSLITSTEWKHNEFETINWRRWHIVSEYLQFLNAAKRLNFRHQTTWVKAKTWFSNSKIFAVSKKHFLMFNIANVEIAKFLLCVWMVCVFSSFAAVITDEITKFNWADPKTYHHYANTSCTSRCVVALYFLCSNIFMR